MLGNPHVRFDERDVEPGAMVGPLRHRQTKGAETDMPGLPPPRHIPTLPDYSSRSVGASAGLAKLTVPRRHLRDLFDGKRAKLAPGFVAPFAGFDLSNAVTPSNLGFNNLGNPRHSETCLCALVGHKRHSRQQRAVNVLRQRQLNRLPRVALYALKRHRL